MEKSPCAVPFLGSGCKWEQGSCLVLVWGGGRHLFFQGVFWLGFFFFQFVLFLLGLADSCLANNSRLCSNDGSKLLMDKTVVLHLACKFSPGLEQI